MKYSLKQINDPLLPVSLNNFLNYLRTIRGKSEKTIYNYKIDLILFFRFLKLYRGLSQNEDFEDVVISDIDGDFLKSISLEDLFAFLSFAEEFRNNGTYARARKIAALRSFFKYLSGKVKLIKENPTLELESPSIPKRNPIYLTLEESEALLNVIDGPFKERDYCIMTLFLNCGLRLSELVSIDISKIKGDTLTIRGKGNKERTIYLNEMCIKTIENYLPVRNKKAALIKENDKDALFISRKLGRINQRTIELMVKKYAKNANLNYEKLTPHKLRHTAATLMYKYGNVDIRSLQQILGHESVSTTQIYTHIDDENLRKAVKSNPLNTIK
ncbi:tyrosine recombinase XerC [Clostridium felsineum]|uniref:Tyrosine recombinase XerD n=1 Tax=Clostridium felsineum TaxID=36839 RepID=A0A1S8M890_9CLOT|nr:tyrosine recombinase XerC [Clostridium felsineum]MCR3761276.1 tyrosine recombinase XerC [Clostridium felsineum]URZ06675.1 Tyrosine recombinase XerD [Clostridium felsineum]URZ11708.1 Tyrosine recombinase XerD [Clostridium felsineum]URZ16268.1 Tyrosine recombinase XerD [Clostridium felsineum DSM 794]